MSEPNQVSFMGWIEGLLARGKNAFSLLEARHAFPLDSEAAIKLKLNRLSRKNKIISIHKGYYLIIVPAYASRGVLPPALFLDGLMKWLGRPYYVGLLNAAALYGAAHQQPQEYYVFTDFPVLRPTQKKNIRINYISKKTIPAGLLEKRKTEAGYLTYSSSALTAADLVQFDQRIGGLNRAATVLNELAEAIPLQDFNESFCHAIPVATLQRLGYLLDRVVHQPRLAHGLWEEIQQAQLPLFRTPLKTSYQVKGFHTDEKWKVIINTDIEIDA